MPNRAPWRFLIAVVCLTHAAAHASASGGEAATQPIDVGSRKQLFIDGLYFATREHVALRLHPATKTDEQTLVSDRPWEDASLNWFSVLEDAGAYRMWYECYDAEGWPTADDTSFCYAESRDGIHWTKPDLGLFSYHGASENNILFRQIGAEGFRSRVHGAGVFLDPAAPPEARYKAVAQGQFAAATPPYRVAGMVSPDGLHWTRIARPICDLFADSQYSAFWDPGIGAYALYGRVSGQGRAIGRATSASFDQFPALTLVLEDHAAPAGDADLYNPAAMPWPGVDGVYVMFPSIYHHAADTLDIGLAVSRDGVHWTWPERDRPFIPLGPSGAFDSGSLYMGQGMLRVGDEFIQYFSGSRLKHNEAELDALRQPENKRVFSRVRSRADGLVSVDADAAEGAFLTPPLTFTGERLTVNVTTRPEGFLRVALCDATGAPLPGFTAEDCIPVTGDHLAAAVRWRSGVSLQPLSGRPVCLRVTLRHASLYAFQFSAAPPQ